MKKCFIISLSLFCAIHLFAQDTIVSTHTIRWTGIEVWKSSLQDLPVINFEEAVFPDFDFLPYYSIRMNVDDNRSYSVEVSNEVYTETSPEERAILHERWKSGNNILVKAYTSAPTMEIQVLPFFSRNDSIFKLSSFDLVITSTEKPLKVAGAATNTFATSSILREGTFVKIRIAESGVYKLTYEDLSAMGITPENVRVFGYGGAVLSENFNLPKSDDLPEIAIWMEKGSDNVFNAGDYILFYAQGANSWTYNKSINIFTHTSNPYSQYGYYFVTSDAGAGRKIELSAAPTIDGSATIHDVTEFLDYRLHEKELSTLIQSGRDLLGESFTNSASRTFSFNFPNISTKTNSMTARIYVASTSPQSSVFSVGLNNSSQSKNINVSSKGTDKYKYAEIKIQELTYTPVGDNCNFTLQYNTSTPTGVGYLNYIELNALRNLTMANAYMPFRSVTNLGTSSYNRYTLSNVSSNLVVWDITDHKNITQVPTSNTGSTMTFTSSNANLKEYLAVDTKASSSFAKPEVLGKIDNQNLHALSNVDMLIITHPLFVEEATTLAEAHYEINQLNVKVATTEQVYNEFSSGTPDASAYRWIMKMLYDQDPSSAKYLLLFGKGCYDNKGMLSGSGSNLVLTFQSDNIYHLVNSYLTDDYYGFMNLSDSTDHKAAKVQIGIGRFPVTTKVQAQAVVQKTINYMKNNNRGNWKNQLAFVADDGDSGLHGKQANQLADAFIANHPDHQTTKIFLDAYTQEKTASGESYPVAKNFLHNKLRSGLFYLNYTGHASASGWTNERILTDLDIQVLTNEFHPLCFAATCDFILFDRQNISSGEHLLINPIGGAIGVISSARVVYTDSNFELNKEFCERLLKKENGQYLRVGDILKSAKNKLNVQINKLSYVYIGDPALRLSYPTPDSVTITQINNNTALGNDTLKALSVNTIKGEIVNELGQKDEEFNGTISVTVFDKVQEMNTLNNDNNNSGIFSFQDRPNIVFSGTYAVTNGAYEITFMLPKDIKYNFGQGKINFYAQCNDTAKEALGHFDNFLIGGSSNNSFNDAEGPLIEYIYLNSPNFNNGDKTNETPYFFARVYDENGINTAGSSIGHDITLTVDNDLNQSYVLNNSFQADANSYQSGTIQYKMEELVEGNHTLVLRVWDLLNNSSTAELSFRVVKGLSPEIFSVLNYPNPVSTGTTFLISHDRPETILNYTVDVFDTSGRIVWSKSAEGLNAIEWNLTTDTGVQLSPGIYFYRVSAKTTNSETVSKTNKMIVVKQ